jgi:primase-polymerase (primpol)-like protein
MSSDIDVSLIPERLADLKQWICWQETKRDRKATKVPIKPYHTNGTPNASATETGHWRDLESALAFHESDRVRTDGIGFVFASATSIVGVDLDDCRDSTTGELTSWAQDIVDRLDSYTEVSPSGQGVHVIVEGELPPGRNRRGDVEMYDEARFFTVTTDHIEGTPTSLERRQDALLGVHYEYVQSPPEAETAPVDLEAAAEGAGRSESSADERGDQAGELAAGEATDKPAAPETATALGTDSGLYARYGLDYPDIEDPGLEAALHGLSPSALPSPLPTSMDDIAGPGVDLDDETVLERAMDSKSGDVIDALYDGRSELWSGRDSRYPSQSEADMGLCFYLAFWTGGDPNRMDRLFRDSGLMRGKWDKVHFANGATYGAVCIARTLLTVDDYYTPPAPSTSSGSDDRHRSPDESSTSPYSGPDQPRESPPIDAGAVEDARRLAAQVQRQQRELDAKRERIAKLEARLRQYRAVLGIDEPDDSVRPRDDGIVDTAAGNGWQDDSSFWNERPTGHDVEESSTISSNGQGDDDHEPTPPDNDEDTCEVDADSSEPETESSIGLSRRLRRWFS